MVIEDLADSITSKEDFDRFLEVLIRDQDVNGDEWENRDLRSFLFGLQGFTKDIEGYYRNRREDFSVERVSWRTIAHILLAATVYE